MVGRLPLVGPAAYPGEVAGRRPELATEAWRLIQDFFMANRYRFIDVAASFDLTPGHMHALLSIDPEHPKPMGALAEGWRCDASQVTWLVDRLEERGFAERRTLPSDRRVKRIVLTPEGRRAQRDVRRRLYEPPPALLALPVDDLEALAAAARKLAQEVAGPAA